MKSTVMADEEESVSMGELFDTQTNALDVQLIELVRDRKALYDIRLPLRDRTKEAKRVLWDEVSRSMQRKLKPLAAEIRWKYLRENYIKARKKQKLKEELAKKTGVPLRTNKYNRKYPYRYYEQMLFLNDALDHQKMLTLKNAARSNRRSKRNLGVIDDQHIVFQGKIESRVTNDVEESSMETGALYDHQYEAVAVAVENNEPDLAFNASTVEVQSCSSLNSTVKSNDNGSVNYENLFLNYLQKTAEKPSPIDGFLARLGEGLKRLPYRDRSKLELEFLSRLNEVEDELGLLN